MPLRDDLINPIPGDNPSGPNLRYDPQIDKIKEARREDLDIPQGDVWKTAIKTADHKLVIKLASEVLAKRSKDLQVAVWLLEAHIRQEGFALVAPSFRLIKDLIDNFWDTIYPEIEDDDLELRATPLEWLGSKLAFYLKELPLTKDKYSWHKYQESRLVGYESAVAEDEIKLEKRNQMISDGKLTPEQFDESVEDTPLDFLDGIALELDESLSVLDELDQLCEEKFGNAKPSYRVTREALEEIAHTLRLIIKEKEKKQPRPEPEEEPAEEYAASSQTFSDDLQMQVDTEVTTPSLERDDLELATPKPARRAAASSNGYSVEPSDAEDAAVRLAAICRYFRKENEVDVAPFMIIRGFRWGELRYTAPPIRTYLLEPPPTELRVKLKKLHKESDWNSIIESCEEAMATPCGRGWLDLQRYCVTALEGRGHNEAVWAIKGMLKGLIEDLPEMLTHTFSDDTPCANDETKKWIEEKVMKKEEPPPPPEEAAADTSSDDSLSLSDDSSSDLSSTDTDSSSLDLDSTDTSSDLSADLATSDGDGAATAPALEELPEPPPPIDLAEPAPILDEMLMETPEPPEPTLDMLEAPVDEGPKDVFEQAIGEVRAGNTRQGIDLINKVLATERSGRARFKRRTQIAHLLIAAGQEQVAKPILTQLTGEIEEHKLEEWEDNEAIAYSIELLLR
ncbi:MAG: type VI secretion system protein TssA, partial [Acidobacteriaceae bacterium]|nr:type VI secretion system protein TssA [Acidobacteriaceae bacterium]